MDPWVVGARLAWQFRGVISAALVAFAVTTWLFLIVVMGALTGGFSASKEFVGASSITCVGASPKGVGLTQEQAGNAAKILAVARRLKIPPRGQVVAIATALQESTLVNLGHGDRDSLGLFQQRPSQGWGSPAETQDVVKSTEAFFGRAKHTNNRGLLDVKGWQTMPVTVAAQTVQGSGFPEAYAKHETQSVAIVEAATGTSGLCEQVSLGGDGKWEAPLPAGGLVPGSPFGMRVHPITGTARMHEGTDFAAAQGTPVFAMSSGKVTHAGPIGGYGNLVIVDHGGGVTTRYAHMSRVDVKTGQRVRAGQQIGAVGSTGQSTGAHLHLEVRVREEAVDPLPWLKDKALDLDGREA
ncbi:M23 family metallopeptidase [Janibacter sp. Soil728]|uniref:M23 family metallopeptidase n=1 Tax=Janibacter sp. Soil728 TaxID=1736393 RepID=UPI000AE6C243|nr:M23 family metallopeptidase [Janibacter sp. Soil728]